MSAEEQLQAMVDQTIDIIMHFPSKDIAKSLNMKVESPFLNEDVIKFSDSIPISRKINLRYVKN